MKVPQLPNDIIEKIMIIVKYEKKQKYYDKCKKWLLNDISNLVDIDYYKYTIKNLKLVDTQKGRYDVDITVTYKHFLNEEIHQYFLDKRIIF
tara:strand:+ start:2516 stop:2791 length:276 start_codon:yes stop_codon:yes gene_type:complete